MHKLNFQISDSEKFDMIWRLLNTEYTEENDWALTYAICDVYDEYVIAYNYQTRKHERIEYTKTTNLTPLSLASVLKYMLFTLLKVKSRHLKRCAPSMVIHTNWLMKI